MTRARVRVLIDSIGVLLLAFWVMASAAAAAGKLGDSCYAWATCGPGLTCHPFFQKCYNSPRLVGQPCVAGFECAKGLTCEAGHHVCVEPSTYAEQCHATKPCAAGFTCQPGVHACYPSPRGVGDPCSDGFACASGLSCAGGVQACYDAPRLAGQPCVTTSECSNGLKCQAFAQRCFPGDFSWDNDYSCAAIWDKRTADLVQKGTGVAATFGAGTIASTPLVISTEIGAAYGPEGRFGCYQTGCGGFASDVNVGLFAALGQYKEFDSIAGTAEVYGGGGSVPLIEIGGSGSVVLATSSSGLKEVVGGTETFGAGIGFAPAQFNALKCTTEVNEVFPQALELVARGGTETGDLSTYPAGTMASLGASGMISSCLDVCKQYNYAFNGAYRARDMLDANHPAAKGEKPQVFVTCTCVMPPE